MSKKFSNFHLFLFIVLAYLAVTYSMGKSLNILDLTHKYWLEVLPKKQADQYFNLQQRYAWLNYAILPLLLLIKVTLVALCLSLGKFFMFMDKRIRFARYFRIALNAEWVFVVAMISKWLYFLLIKTQFSIKELQSFYPLSVLSLFDANKIELWLFYPLQSLNIFELVYWLLMAYGMKKLLSIKFGKGFELVMYAYGGALFLWIGLVTFLTLNFST